MFGLGHWELILIFVVVLIFFGVGKLPTVAKELGSGVRGFKDALQGNDEDDDEPKQLDSEEPANASETPSKTKAEA